MSGRTPSSRRSQGPRATARRRCGPAPDAARARRGRTSDPSASRRVRVTLVVALLGGLAFLAYAVFVRDQLQVPLMASGFAVIGIVFAAMAVMAVCGGRPGRS